MKNLILASVCFSAMLLNIQNVQAQTCVTPPSCYSLGYTKTVSQCSGKAMLKCPLDTTKVYCPSYEETLRTYKVGDTYIGKDGVGVGTVVQVDSTGRHGVVAISGGAGDVNTATTTCASRTAGGLNWGIASTTSSCRLDGGESCCGCYLVSSSGTGYCRGTGSGWSSTSSCSDRELKNLGFYCEAAF